MPTWGYIGQTGPVAAASGSPVPGSVLLPPTGFTFNPGFNIFFNGSTDFSFDSLYTGISVTDYYVSTTGNDSNSGLTPALPKKGIDAAMTAAASAGTDWVRINIASGDYGQSDHPGAGGVTGKNVIFKVTSGNVRTGPFVKGNTLTWTSAGSGAYSASRSAVGQVRDYNTLNAYGDPTKYVNVASLAACQAQAGSWYQSGATVYVHTLTGSSPSDANIFIILAASNTTFSSNYTWIFDGGASGRIELIGGATGCLRCTGGGANQKLYGRNLWMRFSTANNNLYCYGVPFVLFQGGGGSGSYSDVLNYHAESGRIPNVVEIGVTAYDAGADGGGNNNASTVHDGVQIIRILGSYSSTDGPVVADVSDGTKSWNILCSATNSLKGDHSGTDASWLASTGTASMWLDRCSWGGASYYDMSAGTGSTIYYRGPAPTGRTTGAVVTYV